MKKSILAFCSILALSFSLGACSLGGLSLPGKDSSSESTQASVPEKDTASDNSWDNGSNDSQDSGNTDSNTGDTAGDTAAGNEDDTTDNTDDTKTYLYNVFTPSERETQELLFGETIPFAPNDEYYVEMYSYENATGIHFYTYGNTQADFEAYKAKFSGYTFLESYTEEGITCFVYEGNGYYVDIACYLGEDGNSYCIDAYAYLLSGSGESGGEATDQDLEVLMAAYSLSQGETLSGEYILTGVVTDVEKTSKGDVCLTFVVGDYYEYPMYCYWLQDADFLLEGDTITVCGPIKNHYGLVEFYLPELLSYEFGDEGNQGGSGGSQGGNQGGSTSVDLITSDGKGLPTGTNGVYNVDFTQATYVKNVHDQGYYLDGCPTTGDVKALVIPVEFSDVTASSKNYKIQTIETAFNGTSGTDYYSVKEYYKQSSGGKLNLTFDVMDSWFRPSNKSSYYLNATMEYDGSQVECGDQLIIDEFLQKYNSTMDFSQYDSDGNNIIDAIVLINTLEINYDVTMQWAYRYWNLYTDSDGYYYEYDGVTANDYLWASYQFLFEGADGEFNDKSAVNTYTYIHEFGHVLGAEDYYDTAYVGSPMGGNDIMDSETGDHNAFTKFVYGWITTSRLVTASSSVTLTLNDFASTGDTIIIANNWDTALGVYQEYFVLMYYKNDGLNGNGFGYFDEEGVVVYHVNACLYKETYDGTTYYDIYNTNTDISDKDGYGTENNLIELVENGSGYVFGAGDSLSKNTQTDGGSKIAYTFTVNSVSNGSVGLTFTKNS